MFKFKNEKSKDTYAQGKLFFCLNCFEANTFEVCMSSCKQHLSFISSCATDQDPCKRECSRWEPHFLSTRPLSWALSITGSMLPTASLAHAVVLSWVMHHLGPHYNLSWFFHGFLSQGGLSISPTPLLAGFQTGTEPSWNCMVPHQVWVSQTGRWKAGSVNCRGQDGLSESASCMYCSEKSMSGFLEQPNNK